MWGTMVHWLEHWSIWTHDHKVVGSSHDESCVESLSKTLHPHCSSPPRWKKKWVLASYHAGKVKQTRLCRSSVPPQQQQNYTVESGLNAEEEMGTTAESLELQFRLYLYLCHTSSVASPICQEGQSEKNLPDFCLFFPIFPLFSWFFPSFSWILTIFSQSMVALWPPLTNSEMFCILSSSRERARERELP